MSYIKPRWLQKTPNKWLLVDTDPVLGCIDLAEIIVEHSQWRIIIRYDATRVSQKDENTATFSNRVEFTNLFQKFDDIDVAKKTVEQYFGQRIMESGAI